MIERLRGVWLRLKALVRRRQLDRDLDDELAFHLAMREKEYLAAGMEPADARAAACRQFGNVGSLRDTSRDMWTFPTLEGFWQDIRYALRMLGRSPGFAIVAVLALALGIGANTAIFSLVNAVRLRALPYRDPGRLVILWGNVQRARIERRGASFPDFLDWRAQATSFEGMAAFDGGSMTLTGSDEPERINGEVVSAGYFSLLGIDAQRGRTFKPDDDQVPGKIAVAILGDGVWKRQFGANPQVIGRPLQLDGQPFTVVGIMPPGFKGLTDQADLWIPFVMSDSAEVLTERGNRGFQVLARLKAGRGLSGAQSEMDAIARRLEQAYPVSNEKRGVEVSPLDQEVFGDIRPALFALLGAVGFVLLIACANVANLLLARSETRRREIAVRTALGAGWSRLARQLITESCVLTLLGAAAGVCLAIAGVPALLAASPVTFPTYVAPQIDGPVAAFTVIVSLAAGILLGLAPALHARISRLSESLKESARGTDGSGPHRLRNALVVAEVSLALVLLIGAALMMRTFQNLTALDPGFDPRSMLTLRLSLPPPAGPPAAATSAPASRSTSEADRPAAETVTAVRQILERILALPGVRAASLASDLPLGGDSSAIFYTAEGQPPTTAQNIPRGYVHRVTPDFFRTLGIPIRQGRTFTEMEVSTGAGVVVASESVATRFWPGQDPIGRRIKRGGATAKTPWLTIVGVAGEVKYRGLPNNPTADPDLYFPFSDRAQQVSLAVRTGADPSAIAPSIRAAVHEIAPAAPVYDVATLADRISTQTSQSRFTSWLMGLFAATALLLAIIGIYGVMSYLVTRRTRELGIRLALGASQPEILRLIVANGARLIGIGVGVGAIAALALMRLIASLLFGVTGADTAVFAASAALVLVALAACYLPARRASRLDPLRALREE